MFEIRDADHALPGDFGAEAGAACIPFQQDERDHRGVVEAREIAEVRCGAVAAGFAGVADIPVRGDGAEIDEACPGQQQAGGGDIGVDQPATGLPRRIVQQISTRPMPTSSIHSKAAMRSSVSEKAST